MLILRPSPATLQSVDRLADFFAKLSATGPGAGNVAKVAGAIRQGLQENFTTEGAASGARWPSLRPRTAKERRRLGFAGQHMILVRTGAYRASFVQPGRDHISEFRAGHFWTWREGSQDYRARYHEPGGPIIPKRSVVDAISLQAEARIQATFDAILTQLVAQYGR